MERFFQISAVILGGFAGFFLWQGNGDGAFISAVAAAVSFFLNVRFQVKGRLKKREIERLALEEASNETGAHETVGGERQTSTGEPFNQIDNR